jgi:hypothetical protein
MSALASLFKNHIFLDLGVARWTSLPVYKLSHQITVTFSALDKKELLYVLVSSQE